MTETKCWSCANEAFSKCKWAHGGQAVEGWTAKKTTITGGIVDGKPVKIKSYLVKECPNYIKENRANAKPVKPIKSKNKCKFCGKELEGCKAFCGHLCYDRYQRKQEIENHPEKCCIICGEWMRSAGIETPLKRIGSDEYAKAHKKCWKSKKGGKNVQKDCVHKP